VRDFQHDGVDVVVGDVVVPGPLESVQGALDVGEERVAAQPGEEPESAHPGRLGGAVEADRDGLREDLADRPGLAGRFASGVPGGPFQLVGHDRGARTGHRLVLDHPDAVTRFAVLDIVPTPVSGSVSRPPS